MSCDCGCGAGIGAACAYWPIAKRIGAACAYWPVAKRIGAPRPSRMRRRARGIGDASDGGTEDWTGELSAYVQAGLSDYQTARAAFSAAQQALDVLNAKTQAQWKAAQAGMETFVTILATAAGAAWLGALFNSWFSQQPGAAAGPGECVTSPPSSPDWPTLKTWAYYKPWGTPFSSDYPSPKPGTFEAFAQPQLEYNKVLYNNCFDDKATDRAELLAHLVAVWNANHQGPSRTIARKVNPSGWGDIPLWDPIADALWWGLDKKYPCDGAFCTNPNEPTDVTLTFQVNDGPEIQPPPPKVVTLRITPQMQSHPLVTAAAAPAPRASGSAGTTAAVVAGAGLIAAGGLYVYLRGLPPALAKLLR